MTATIPLPERCLTLLPPWPQAILHAGKCLENRGYGVVRQLGDYRGLIGLSQSKGFSANYTEDDAYAATVDLMNRGMMQLVHPYPDQWQRTAGKLFIIAELTRIVSPDLMAAVPEEGHPLSEAKKWHVPGQWGLILGSVWEVEPVPCTGGVGAWQPGLWCRCGHVYADSAKLPARCFSCKEGFADIERPQLKVVREVGA
jgi:hypothetical protein